MRRRNRALVLAFFLVFTLFFSQNAFATVAQRDYCVAGLMEWLDGNDWLNINASFTSSSQAVSIATPCFTIWGSNVTININYTTITNNGGFGTFVLIFPGLTNVSIINTPIGYGTGTGVEQGIITNASGALITGAVSTTDLTVQDLILLNATSGVFLTPPTGLVNFNFTKNKVRLASSANALEVMSPVGLNISYNVFYNATTRTADVNVSKGTGNIYIHDNIFMRTASGEAYMLLIQNTNSSQIYSNSFTNDQTGTINAVDLQWINNTVFKNNTLINVTLAANQSQQVVNNTFYSNMFAMYKNETAAEVWGLTTNFSSNTIEAYQSSGVPSILLFLNDSWVIGNEIFGNASFLAQFGRISELGRSSAVSKNYSVDNLSVSTGYQNGPITIMQVNNVLNSSFANGLRIGVHASLVPDPSGPFTELGLNGTNNTNFTDMNFRFSVNFSRAVVSGNYTINSTNSFNNTFLSPALPAEQSLRTYTDGYSNLTFAWYVYLKTQYANGTAFDGVDVNLTNSLSQTILSCTTNSTGFCATKYNVSQMNDYPGGWSPQYNNYTLQGNKTGVGYATNQTNVTADSTFNLEFVNAEYLVTPQFWWQSFNFTNGSTYSTPLTIQFFANWSDDFGVSEVNLTFDNVNYTMLLWNGSATNGVWNANISGLGVGTHYFNYTGHDGTLANTSNTFSIVIASAVCGNGICESGETIETCPQDCTPRDTPTPTPSPTATPTPTPSPTATPTVSPTASPTAMPTTQPSAPVDRTVETPGEEALNTTPVCKPGVESTLETTRTVRVFERQVKEGNKIVRKFFTLVTLKVTNTGLNAVANVLIEEKLPDGNAVFQQQPYLIVGRRVSWLVQNLAAGESKEFSYVVDRIVGMAEFSEATAMPAKITAANPDYTLYYAIIIAEAAAATAVYLKGRKKGKKPSSKQ